MICEMEDGVALAAVIIGVPNDILGQAIKAFVICSTTKTLTTAAVLSHCKRHLNHS